MNNSTNHQSNGLEVAQEFLEGELLKQYVSRVFAIKNQIGFKYVKNPTPELDAAIELMDRYFPNAVNRLNHAVFIAVQAPQQIEYTRLYLKLQNKLMNGDFGMSAGELSIAIEEVIHDVLTDLISTERKLDRMLPVRHLRIIKQAQMDLKNARDLHLRVSG